MQREAPSVASKEPDSPAHEALGPLLWKLESADGQVSYVLASGQDVSSEQLIPEVWQRFDESRQLLLEMNVGAYLDWLRAREPTLPDMLGQGAFEDLLIAVPGMPADALARMPTAFVASGLAAPAKHPGATSANAFLLKAQASDKPVHYLVADVAEYVDPFEAVLSDIDALRENMADRCVSNSRAAVAAPGLSQRRDQSVGTPRRTTLRSTSPYSNSRIALGLKRSIRLWLRGVSSL